MESPNAHDISNHTKQTIIVGIDTDMVVFMAVFNGATHHVNKNINPMNISGNSKTSNIVLILL
jgi:hypothetical protein